MEDTLRRVNKKTSVYLGTEELRLLDELERHTGRSRSQLLRDGIRALADQLPARPRPRSLGMTQLAPGPQRWDADELARRRGLDR
jgi:Ribbon-helix-helix protein, copG family